MRSAAVNGVDLEYEVRGSGEPVLLISPVVADGFLPFFTAPGLVDRYTLIRYHRRGWSGGTPGPTGMSIAGHAADAAGLVEELGVGRAHVAGHSSGGAVALQLALDRPDLVHTLTLLEPSLMSVPAAPALLARAAGAFEAYAAGNHERAVADFLTVVSGLEWSECRAAIDETVPGGVAQAIRDADTFFGVELPALGAWAFGAEEAARISMPVLSVLGSDTDGLWAEVDDRLRSWIGQAESLTIDGVGHLLHMQRPGSIARDVAAFLERHPIPPVEPRSARTRGSA